jgi:hypothetical protein
VRPYLEKTLHKNRAQSEGPEFKFQYCKKKRYLKENITILKNFHF